MPQRVVCLTHVYFLSVCITQPDWSRASVALIHAVNTPELYDSKACFLSGSFYGPSLVSAWSVSFVLIVLFFRTRPALASLFCFVLFLSLCFPRPPCILINNEEWWSVPHICVHCVLENMTDDQTVPMDTAGAPAREATDHRPLLFQHMWHQRRRLEELSVVVSELVQHVCALPPPAVAQSTVSAPIAHPPPSWSTGHHQDIMQLFWRATGRNLLDVRTSCWLVNFISWNSRTSYSCMVDWASVIWRRGDTVTTDYREFIQELTCSDADMDLNGIIFLAIKLDQHIRGKARRANITPRPGACSLQNIEPRGAQGSSPNQQTDSEPEPMQLGSSRPSARRGGEGSTMASLCIAEEQDIMC